ncbi:ester cyclase [Rhizobium nepotum]|uniref:ester cyclase n=1 Tax=Rhizobium nepotum TaxID=1035271 RepID=UPI003CE80C67
MLTGKPEKPQPNWTIHPTRERHIGDTRGQLRLDYLDCLNRRAFDELGTLRQRRSNTTDARLGCRAIATCWSGISPSIPDLSSRHRSSVSNGTRTGARLFFDCAPKIHLHGTSGQWQARCGSTRARFLPNWNTAKIRRVWSVIDKAEIERQLGGASSPP